MSAEERWAKVATDARYEVSDFGRVRSLVYRDKERSEPYVLKQRISTTGYPTVGLPKNGKMVPVCVHKLVLEAFVGPRPPGHECCHFNDIKTDNRLENLRWGTVSDNKRDAVRNGVVWGKNLPHPCGKNHPYWGKRGPVFGASVHTAKLSEEDVMVILAAGGSNAEVARRYGVTKGCVRLIRARETWKHLILPCITPALELVDELEPSARGAGGFGSTGS